MTTTSNAVAGIFIGENISNSSTTYIIWTSGQTNNDHEIILTLFYLLP
jgi:hypothetical protein